MSLFIEDWTQKARKIGGQYEAIIEKRKFELSMRQSETHLYWMQHFVPFIDKFSDLIGEYGKFRCEVVKHAGDSCTLSFTEDGMPALIVEFAVLPEGQPPCLQVDLGDENPRKFTSFNMSNISEAEIAQYVLNRVIEVASTKAL